MTDMSIEELVPVARSWNLPPQVKQVSDGYVARSYDRGQRAYVLAREKADAGDLSFRLAAGQDGPAYDPAFVIRNWGEAGVEVVRDGKSLAREKQYRAGYSRQLTRTDLVVWLDLEFTDPVTLRFERKTQ